MGDKEGCGIQVELRACSCNERREHGSSHGDVIDSCITLREQGLRKRFGVVEVGELYKSKIRYVVGFRSPSISNVDQTLE